MNDWMTEKRSNERKIQMNLLWVCIDEMDGDDPKGRIYSRLADHALRFSGCAGLLLKADKLFDQCGYPQNFQESRSFTERKRGGSGRRPYEKMESAQICSQRGKLDTLEILVETRRHSGWQGSLTDKNGNREVYQSDIELMHKLGEMVKKKTEKKMDRGGSGQ